ncbi:MAG: hypothetical protein EON47_16690, partial [Acetobacteraceae bacterium]
MTTSRGTHMSLAHFALLLDRHGPLLARWPAAERDTGARLLAGSAEARAMLTSAVALDARLRQDLAQPSPAAVARLRDSVARHIARAPLPASLNPLDRLRAALRPAV